MIWLVWHVFYALYTDAYTHDLLASFQVRWMDFSNWFSNGYDRKKNIRSESKILGSNFQWRLFNFGHLNSGKISLLQWKLLFCCCCCCCHAYVIPHKVDTKCTQNWDFSSLAIDLSWFIWLNAVSPWFAASFSCCCFTPYLIYVFTSFKAVLPE